MAEEPFITPEQAAEFGYTLTAADIKRALSRIQAYVGLRLIAQTSTVTATGEAGSIRLPERPVRSVTSVIDLRGRDVPHLVQNDTIFLDYPGIVGITYESGFTTVPDSLIELVCSIASRIAAMPSAITAGTVTEAAGGESVSYGYDAWKGATSLVSEEKNSLDRMFPRHRLGLIVFGGGR